LLSIQSREQTTVIYVDFLKAFDVVSHVKLFTRLHGYGIQGSVLLWLRSFFYAAKCVLTTKLGFNTYDVLSLYR